METLDVLVAESFRPGPGHDDRVQLVDPIELPDGVIVQRRDFAADVITACTPRGRNFEFPVNTGSVFCLTAPVDAAKQLATITRWDSQNLIRRAVSCSRMIRPNATSAKQAAQVTLNTAGQVDQIIPFPGQRTYSVNVDQNWLSRNEWLEVGSLITSWTHGPAGKIGRVWRTIWYVEKVFLEPQFDVKWPLLVTAIEILLGHDWKAMPSPHGRTKQFYRSVIHLSSIVGAPMTLAEAEEAWDVRSLLSHGQPDPVLHGGQGFKKSIPLYAKLERNLLRFLRMLVEDDSLSANLATERALRAWF